MSSQQPYPRLLKHFFPYTRYHWYILAVIAIPALKYGYDWGKRDQAALNEIKLAEVREMLREAEHDGTVEKWKAKMEEDKQTERAQAKQKLKEWMLREVCLFVCGLVVRVVLIVFCRGRRRSRVDESKVHVELWEWMRCA